MIDGGIFTAPPRFEHSGAALLDAEGKLVGVGSLWVSDALEILGNEDQLKGLKDDRGISHHVAEQFAENLVAQSVYLIVADQDGAGQLDVAAESIDEEYTSILMQRTRHPDSDSDTDRQIDHIRRFDVHREPPVLNAFKQQFRRSAQTCQ